MALQFPTFENLIFTLIRNAIAGVIVVSCDACIDVHADATPVAGDAVVDTLTQ